MFKTVDEFLLYGPYAGIWALVIGRLDFGYILSLLHMELKVQPQTEVLL